MIVLLWANEIFNPEKPDTKATIWEDKQKMKKIKIVTVVGTRPGVSFILCY